MADHRPETEDSARKKRQKTSHISLGLDPEADQSVAHIHKDAVEKMAEHRPEFEASGRKKRRKVSDSSSESDPEVNPYLNHVHKDEPEDSSTKKRQKVSHTSSKLDPEANPYLAHLYKDSTEENESKNNYTNSLKKTRGFSDAMGLSNFPRHATDAAMARKAEDGPLNPFNGKPLSKRYFEILQTRRNLPVHAQRYEVINSTARRVNHSLETNFSKHIMNHKF